MWLKQIKLKAEIQRVFANQYFISGNMGFALQAKNYM